MSENDWKHLAYGLLIINTLCSLILLEMVMWGKPFITLFLMIFAATVYFNLKIFKKKKKKKEIAG